MQHRAAIGDADESEDLGLARLGVELDLDETGRERRNRARARQIVLRDADQTGAGHAGRRRLRHGVQVVRHLVPVELTAKLDRALRGLRIRQTFSRIALREYPLAADIVVVRRAAQIHRRDLL